MAERRPLQKKETQERFLRSPVPGEREERLWRFILFSGLLHAGLIWTLWVVPRAPFHRPASYPVYTVELVGGETIGGTALGSETAPPPAPKKEPEKLKSVKVEPPPPVQITKKEKKKSVESPRQMQEKVAIKKSKSEMEKAPEAKSEMEKASQAREGLSENVRDKLIQAALERVKDRARGEPKKPTGAGASSGPGEGEGAAALGPGGKGGGIVKGVEFLIYRNRMLQLIRDRWTWGGKRSDLEVTVRFGIVENGEIVGLKIVRVSGDPSYDDSVIRAVKKASPLPAPPDNYRKDFMDVELTFRPKDLGG